MDFYNFILGLCSITLGILSIYYFQKLTKIKASIFYIKFQTAGIIFIMIGVELLIRGCK